tara:strand:- start:1622 stop:3166 length:1545 start_codon:yes stop_codon:yes gene_type:complete
MKFSAFARLCESLEYVSPTTKVNLVSQAMKDINTNNIILMKVLALEFPISNIGSKRVQKWVCTALGIFDDELDDSIYTWGDLAEAVAQIDEGNETDSDYSLAAVYSMLCLDYSRMEGSNTYDVFQKAFNSFSAREKKWFIRYWLRTPRNGISNKIPLKILGKRYHFKLKDIEYFRMFNDVGTITEALEGGYQPECKLEHGVFVSPMLAKPRKGQERPDKYIIDVKYDGNRYQIHKKGKDTIIFNRKGKIVTAQFPDVVESVSHFEIDDAILDTEIYPINPRGGEPAEHKLMAKRVHKKNIAEAVEQCPVQLAVFDVLSINGEVCIDMVFSERLIRLKQFVPDVFQAKRFESESIKAAYNLAIDWGYEGIMIKDADMTYQAGKRSKGWLKYKPPLIELDVVITSASYGEGKRSNVFGTFGISVKDGSDYVPVGKVGTGFSDWDLDFLTKELRKNVDYFEGDTYYFLPRVVLTVRSDLVSTDAKGNIGLRFPRSRAIRHDKFASDADTLTRLQEMA